MRPTTTGGKCCITCTRTQSRTRRMGWIAFLFASCHGCSFAAAAAWNVRRQNNAVIKKMPSAGWKRMVEASTPRWQHQEVGRSNTLERTAYAPSYRSNSISSSRLDLDQNGLHEVSVNNDNPSSMTGHSPSMASITSSISLPSSSSSSSSHSSDTFNDTVLVSMDTPARQSLPSHLSLRSIPGKGLGVICLKSISIGEVVGEYKGEVLSQEVKDRRYLPSLKDQQTDEDRKWIQSRRERGQTLSGCYLYGVSVPPKREKSSSTETTIYIDAEDEYTSLWTRFLNHAPLPFGNVHPKSIHESYDGKPRVWFVANRNIAVGEEICFDYGDDYWLEGDDVVV